ncbi:MAG: hypothetical protein JWO68_3912 [Actinomycetia bacterium]|nr:hypothetical protein [Actinomycetes bacterium]
MIVLDPLLPAEEADAMVSLWHEVGDFGQYSNEGFATQFAPELAQRYDAAANFVRTRGRFHRTEDVAVAAARTNYFRETYAYGDDVTVPGIEVLLHHSGFAEAARTLHGRPVIVPAIVYANILLPGQELAVHTDVPEFRGANRKTTPQWLLVVMHHAGLFDDWRMPIATGIAYFGHASGGELAYYPDGATGPAATFAPRHDTAVVLDTDTVFHGVDRVDGDDSPLASLKPGMRLRHRGDGRWAVVDGDREVVTYGTDDLRYSVSWKGYCFTDDAERAAWSGHHDDLDLDAVLARLVDDLVDRGRLASVDDRPGDAELGRLLIKEHIRFP